MIRYYILTCGKITITVFLLLVVLMIAVALPYYKLQTLLAMDEKDVRIAKVKYQLEFSHSFTSYIGRSTFETAGSIWRMVSLALTEHLRFMSP
jgi:hypothetical protein